MDIERTKRDKFLTEEMGECWHEWIEDLDEYTNYACKLCNEPASMKWNNNFSKPDGFFKLFNWTKEQKWFEDLLYRYWSCPSPRKVFPYHFIDPDKFANSLYKFLNGEFPSYYLECKKKGKYD